MPSILNLKFKGNKSFVAFSNLNDTESLTKTWKVCTKVASYLEQGQRLENLSWRLWHLQSLMVDTDNAKSKREFKKLSRCMGDRLDKEKGRNIEDLTAPDFKRNHSTDLLRQRAEEKERNREASQNAEPGTIKRMQFTFAVDQQVPAPVDAKTSSKGLGKKPNPGFNLNNKRLRETSATSNHMSSSSSSSSSQPQHEDQDPQLLHFPSFLSTSFTPSALLFPTPTLTSSTSYGEYDHSASSSTSSSSSFRVARPTIELGLDELMEDDFDFTTTTTAPSFPPGLGLEAGTTGVDVSMEGWEDMARDLHANASEHESDAREEENENDYLTSFDYPSPAPAPAAPPVAAVTASSSDDSDSDSSYDDGDDDKDDSDFELKPRRSTHSHSHSQSNINSAVSATYTPSQTYPATSPYTYNPYITNTTPPQAVYAFPTPTPTPASIPSASAPPMKKRMSKTKKTIAKKGKKGSAHASSSLGVVPVVKEIRTVLAPRSRSERERERERERESTPIPTTSSTSTRPVLSVRTTSSSGMGASSAPVGGTVGNTGNNGSTGGAGQGPGGVKAECSNCGATHTPLWRRGLNDELNCNACGLYCKLHKRPRPKTMRNTHDNGRNQSTPRPETVDVMAQCYNCHTTATPLWRKDDEGKTVCNACGLYYKLHGSARPISMKSDVIRKRSRHDARRMGNNSSEGQTPSASPGVSRRASPTPDPEHDVDHEMEDVGVGVVGLPTIVSDSSTSAWGASSTKASELLGALGAFPGPYHPDYLPSMYPLPGEYVMDPEDDDDDYSNPNSNADSPHNEGEGNGEDNRSSKRRRMSTASETSASEPPSSVGSFSSFNDDYSNSGRSASMDFPFSSYPSVAYNHVGPSSSNNSGNTSGNDGRNGGTLSLHHHTSYSQHHSHQYGSAYGALRSSAAANSFLHPPMMPQSHENTGGSPGMGWHPPMLPPDDNHKTASSSSSSWGFSYGEKDNGGDYYTYNYNLHPPMLPPPVPATTTTTTSSANDGEEEWSQYFHPASPPSNTSASSGGNNGSLSSSGATANGGTSGGNATAYDYLMWGNA